MVKKGQNKNDTYRNGRTKADSKYDASHITGSEEEYGSLQVACDVPGCSVWTTVSLLTSLRNSYTIKKYICGFCCASRFMQMGCVSGQANISHVGVHGDEHTMEVCEFDVDDSVHESQHFKEITNLPVELESGIASSNVTCDRTVSPRNNVRILRKTKSALEERLIENSITASSVRVHENSLKLNEPTDNLSQDELPSSVSSKFKSSHRVYKKNRSASRDRCILFANLSESNSSVSQERVNDDVSAIRGVLNKIFHANDKDIAKEIVVRSLFRLGRRTNSSNIPRLLKVVVDSSTHANYIFSRAHRLEKDSIRILRDLSFDDRSKLKNARNELHKRLLLGEKDLCIRNFRVVRRKPFVRWKPLEL